MGNTDKVVKNIADCREMGIEVLPPDINASVLSFRVLGKSIRFGLGAVKNVGESAIEAILAARNEGPFKDLFDFCERVNLRTVNKRVVESLIKCGSFDSTGARRSQLMAILEDVMAIGQRIQQERESVQVSLFGAEEIVRTNGNGKGGTQLPDLPEWDDKFLLNQEKEALGFFITGHPLSRYANDIKRFATADTAKLAELPDKGEVKLCGIVVALKESITKKGDRMAFVTLEDLVGSVEVVMFPETFAKCSEFLKSDDPLLVTGTIDQGEKGAKVMANEVVLLREVNARETKQVVFTLAADGLDRSQLESLREIMRRYPGNCRVTLAIEVPAQFRTLIAPADSYTVAASEELAVEVKNLFGYNAVSFE
jgi:DNA polymerase-3 subunit alpha